MATATSPSVPLPRFGQSLTECSSLTRPWIPQKQGSSSDRWGQKEGEEASSILPQVFMQASLNGGEVDQLVLNGSENLRFEELKSASAANGHQGRVPLTEEEKADMGVASSIPSLLSSESDEASLEDAGSLDVEGFQRALCLSEETKTGSGNKGALSPLLIPSPSTSKASTFSPSALYSPSTTDGTSESTGLSRTPSLARTESAKSTSSETDSRRQSLHGGGGGSYGRHPGYIAGSTPRSRNGRNAVLSGNTPRRPTRLGRSGSHEKERESEKKMMMAMVQSPSATTMQYHHHREQQQQGMPYWASPAQGFGKASAYGRVSPFVQIHEDLPSPTPTQGHGDYALSHIPRSSSVEQNFQERHATALPFHRSRSVTNVAGQRYWEEGGQGGFSDPHSNPNTQEQGGSGFGEHEFGEHPFNASVLNLRPSGSGRLQPVGPGWLSGAPGAGGSFRVTSSAGNSGPPPPLRLEPLLRALEEGDTDRVRDRALDVRFALKGFPENKALFMEAGGIPVLVQLARMSDPWIVEHGVTCIFNLCRDPMAAEELEAAGAFEPLVKALKAQRPAAKENAAAAIFLLCDHVVYGEQFLSLGVVPHLLHLLRGGTLRGQKDAALALFNLLKHPDASAAVVEGGGTEILLSLLQSSQQGLEDKVMAVVASLAKCPEGRQAILSCHETGKEGPLLRLIDVLELASRRAREDAVSALFYICSNDNRALRELAKEGILPALRKVCQSPSERARSKAAALLQLLRRCPS